MCWLFGCWVQRTDLVNPHTSMMTEESIGCVCFCVCMHVYMYVCESVFARAGLCAWVCVIHVCWRMCVRKACSHSFYPARKLVNLRFILIFFNPTHIPSKSKFHLQQTIDKDSNKYFQWTKSWVCVRVAVCEPGATQNIPRI